jgi:hypothetical protein
MMARVNGGLLAAMGGKTGRGLRALKAPCQGSASLAPHTPGHIAFDIS